MQTLTVESLADVHRAQRRLRAYAGSAVGRLRLQAAMNALAVALTISAWSLPLLIVAEKVFSLKLLGVDIWVIWGGLSLMGIPFVLWRAFAPGLHERRAAIIADERLGLNARLSSALSLDFSDPINAPFGGAFLNEATHKMSVVKVHEAFPLRVPRAFGWLLFPALIAAAVFYFMPKQDVLGLAAKVETKRKADELKKATAENMQGKLEDLKKKLDEKPTDENGAAYKVNQLIKEADAVAKELKDDKKNAEQSMQALVALKQKIEDEKEKIQRGKEFSERIEKLQDKDLNLGESDHTKDVSEALKNGDAGLAAKEMRKVAQKIKDLLNDPNKSDEEKKKEIQKLQKEMEKLASALAEDEAMRDKLKEISETSMSAAEFQKLGEEMKKQEERQNKKSNKKFGDQIERQMEDAANELERLEEENDTKLKEDEKEEMKDLDALENGVDEAVENLAEDGEGKTGQNPGGGKPGDKSGKGQSQGPGKGKLKSMRGRGSKAGKSGEGSKEGKGQGNEPGGKNGEGKSNPNGEPGNGLGGGPGQGKRPYRDGDTTFISEKAKGELRAGAITGISHFRGQGAKGEAPQEFYQSFDPANKDGASSLEMERWPADRRDMVKDYFTRVREGAAPLPTQAKSPTAAPDAPVNSGAPKKDRVKE